MQYLDEILQKYDFHLTETGSTGGSGSTVTVRSSVRTGVVKGHRCSVGTARNGQLSAQETRPVHEVRAVVVERVQMDR